MSRSLVVIPTYNEAENVPTLIPIVLAQHESLDVLIVDDNSPDGTARIVKEMQEAPLYAKRIHLIERASKQGLGTAYVAGFTYALEHGFEYVFEMDADFSHDPEELPRMLREAEQYDFVVGSRYISGVNVVNWPLRRLILSYGANLYTRLITGLPVRDATSGFACIRCNALKEIGLGSVRSNGYAFQIEIKYLMWKKGFRLHEIPIVFVDRRVGISKMSKGIMTEAALMVWKLKLRSFF